MKILIIRFSSMGDIVMATPVIRTLREQLDPEIHFLTKPEYQPLLEANPHIDRLILWQPPIKPILQNLRSEKFDFIVDLHRSLRSRVLCFRLNRPVLDYGKQALAKWLFLKLRIDRLDKRSMILQYLDSLTPLNVLHDGKGLDFFLKPKVQVSLPENDLPRVALVMGGRYKTKRIPVPLANGILRQSQYQFFLLGGNDLEERMIDVGNYPNVDNFIGRTSIQESAYIINQSDIIVSGDTGLMHIAAALRKPLVVIWGGTSEIFGFGPFYGNQSNPPYRSVEISSMSCRPCSKYGREQCPLGHMNCLLQISPNSVILAINELLGKNL